jgi:hypothetical protein
MLEKLKSRKLWLTVLGTAMPLIVQAITKEISWVQALMMSGMALLVGLGVIGAEDVAKIGAVKELEKAKIAAGTK